MAPQCSVPRCEKPSATKGMCRQHYHRAWRGVPVEPEAPTKCGFCGLGLPEPRYGKCPPMYCSIRCRNAAGYARRGAAMRQQRRDEAAQARAAVTKVCPTCGAEFSPNNTVRQIFCSKNCGRKAHQDSSSHTCEIEGCDKPHRAKGMCAMHWRRAARADGREGNPEWDDRRRANYHRRRALKAGAGAVDFSPADVFERDGWVCGICCELVDPDTAWPDPRSASLDHIVPLSKGGTHSPDNAQCAHLVCTVSKGARVG